MCLKRGVACEPGLCACVGCLNDDRPEAQKARLEQLRSLAEAVRKGCNCKRNYCRKNYCICHGKGLYCEPELCNCTGCHNYEGAPPVPTSNPADKASEPRKRRKVASVKADETAKNLLTGGDALKKED